MKKFLLTCFSLCITISAVAWQQQKPIEIKLTKRPGDQAYFDDFALVPLVPVEDQYSSPRLSMNLIVPEADRTYENGIIELRFFGGTHPSNFVLVMVADYKSDSPRFYIDQNQNGNFTDDAPHLTFNKGLVHLDLKNNKNQKGIYRAMLKRLPVQNDESRARWKNNSKRKFPNTELSAPDYWFSLFHRNMLSADVEINGLQFQLGLLDTNLNGLYTDDDDRLLIGQYGSDRMFTDFGNGAYRVGDHSPFAVGNKGFSIKSISPDGRVMHIVPIGVDQVKTILKAGDSMPDLLIESLSGNQEKFADLLEAGKYTFIDFWATWCKGCIEELPQIQAAADQYSDRLKVIGLHCSTVSNERLKNFIQSKKLSWTQKIAPDAVVEQMRISGFPYGILLKPDGKIAAFNIRIEDVIEHLK